MGLTVDQCKAYLAEALRDERLRDLWEGIRKQGEGAPPGCGPSLTVEVRECGVSGPEGTARAFVEAPPLGVVLCANRLGDLHQVADALRHELVHAFDICSSRLDLSKCSQLAWSEVRAAREAECRVATDAGLLAGVPFSVLKRVGLLGGLQDECIRRTAIRATKALFPVEGDDCVAAAFDEAVKDLRPIPTPAAPAPAAQVPSPPSAQRAAASEAPGFSPKATSAACGFEGARWPFASSRLCLGPGFSLPSDASKEVRSFEAATDLSRCLETAPI